MGHDDVALGYLISTGFRRFTGCQQDPRDRGVTDVASLQNLMKGSHLDEDNTLTRHGVQIILII